jgi:hypothetical protein
MRHTFHDTKTGAEVNEASALDEHGVIRDGLTMRTAVSLMDGVPLTDEQKHEQREARKARLSDAWRNPDAQFRDEGTDTRDAALDKLADAYERRNHRLENAWR